MLTGELLDNQIPQIHLNDTIGHALQLFNDHKATHLPVVDQEKFAGIIREGDLLDAADENKTVQTLEKEFLKTSLKDNVHFLQAFNICNQFHTNIVPIINNEGDYLGTISSEILIRATGAFLGVQDQSALLILEMEKNQFSISEISRIVESNDATILHLNTAVDILTGLLKVTIQLNKKELSSIVATFERYEYRVIYYFGDEKFENDIQNNYENLMNYLEI